MRKFILAVIASGIWISFSEFLRNELLFKSYWIGKYAGMGLQFPSSTINNALWGLWSFILAGAAAYLAKRLKFLETVVILWVLGFVLMWIVIGNLNVLPYGLLVIALPWSVVEVAVAVLIVKKIIAGQGVSVEPNRGP
jgi:hypothetical protein